MDVNILAVIVCGIISMVIGAIWYGPLFGKKWMAIIGVTPKMMNDPACKEQQKGMWKAYVIQFLVALIQIYTLAYAINLFPEKSGVVISLCLFLGFVFPLVVGGCLWNNESKQKSWNRFMIQGSYQLVVALLFGWILSVWK